MHYIFCVSGFSGTGKDEFCRRLVEGHSAVHTGLADPAKRHMADIYGFTHDQLFGPSHMRNAGDPRYPKTAITKAGARLADMSELLDISGDDHTDPEKIWWCADLDLTDETEIRNLVMAPNGSACAGKKLFQSRRLGGTQVRIFFEDTNPMFFLSPREALQKYCDLMNRMYLCTWVQAGVELHRKLAVLRDILTRDDQVSRPVHAYDRMLGLMPNEFRVGSEASFHRQATYDVVTCFSDFRHRHEIRYVREAERERGGFRTVLIRVKRPGVEKPPFNHRSETEQATIPDSEFDYVVDNNNTISGLHAVVDTIVSQVKGESK